MSNAQKSRVFVSHGHDEISLRRLTEFLRDRLGVEAVVLKDRHEPGVTVIEKLETHAGECDFAIVLFTGDDETKVGAKRARQNVVHELGFLQGRLGRRKVLLCQESGVESFSNISGLVYAEFPTGSIENVFEIIRQSIENLDAEPFAMTVPTEDTKGSKIVSQVIDVISRESSGEDTRRRLRIKYEELTKNLSHLDDQTKMMRIRQRLETQVKEGDEFEKKHQQESMTETETEPPKNPVGAALGKALYSSVIGGIKERHKILKELLQDIIYFQEQGYNLEAILNHMKKVLYIEPNNSDG